MKRISVTLLLFCIVSTVLAQADTIAPATADSSKPAFKTKSYFSASLSFLSNSIYNGRKDSVSTPYITPMIGYYDKSGFFIDASASYLAKSGSGRIDLFNIEAGYDFSIGNFDGEVVAGKPFYNSNSSNVKSSITGTLFASGGYDFDFIKPTFEAGINFGTKSDYVLNFGLEHTFYAADDKLQFTPTFLGEGSTTNYYGSYYNKKRIGGKKKNGGVLYDVSASVENASSFKMLDYQFSLPVLYIYKKCSFNFSPGYVLPVNPAVIVTQVKPQNGTTTTTRTSTEVLSNGFYFSVGATYKF